MYSQFIMHGQKNIQLTVLCCCQHDPIQPNGDVSP